MGRRFFHKYNYSLILVYKGCERLVQRMVKSLKTEIKLMFLKWKRIIIKSRLGWKIAKHFSNDWMIDVFCAFIGMIIISIIFFAIYWALYLLIFALVELYYQIAKLNIKSDSWINFSGSLLGGLITMLGVIMTVRYERKRDEKSRLQQAQPILILQDTKDCEANKPGSEYNSSCFFSTETISPKNGIQLRVPDIIIENIGHNVALDVSIDVNKFPFYTLVVKRLKKIYPGTIEKVAIFLLLDKDEILKKMYVVDDKVSDVTKLLEDIYVRLFLGDEKYDLVDRRAFFKGSIILTYKDLYKNEYKQEFDSLFRILKVKDEFYGFFESVTVSKSLPDIS